MRLLRAEVLCERGAPMSHAYFPCAGFVSMLRVTDGHAGLEVAMVGREGMVGAQLALGVAAPPTQAVVMGEGSAWRIGEEALRRELASGSALKQGLDRYLAVIVEQLAVAVACRRFHEIGPRLARWLLMGHDRMRADRFDVTHETLAHLLGVRRVGITAAAGLLQSAGLIGYHRGHVTVRDRPGLELVACSCYVADDLAYQTRLR